MKGKIVISVLFLFAAGAVKVSSQIIVQPNTGLKSHETMELGKIEITSGKTVVYFTIENRLEGGNFCADKNIFIIYPDGRRIKLINAEGIPVCPDNYKFKSIGEKLDFSLTFPALRKGTEWIDIVEECESNCFYFYGITLNPELNKRLDEAFILAAEGDPVKTMQLFRKILESADNQNQGIEGSLYINIISAAIESGDKVEAAVWYKRLLSSHAPRLNLYVKFLNDRGIKF
jgi:hypothetical protein